MYPSPGLAGCTVGEMSEGILELGDEILRVQGRPAEQRRRQRRRHQQLMLALQLAMFESTYAAWAIVAGLAVVWHYHIESVVPRPYLVRLSLPLRKSVVADSES